MLALPVDGSILRTPVPGGARPGDVLATHGGREVDPFARLADDLLLAEAFARFDLSRPRRAQAWYLEHGVVALGTLFPDDVTHPLDLIDGFEVSQDSLEEVLAQQAQVRWHLESLVRLTEHRDAAQRPRPGWQPHEGWERRWSSVVLPDHEMAVWVGAPTDAMVVITADMQRYPRAEDAPPSVLKDLRVPEGRTARWVRQVWWPEAHRAWRMIGESGVPVLWAPRAGWEESWWDWRVDGYRVDGRQRRGPLPTDWHGLLELQRRLIEPYVKAAAAFHVEVDRDPVASEDATGQVEMQQPLVMRERRRWLSILAPIHLQLLEGLRRVSEGNTGAVRCKECGQPFLALDARRSVYCTDRERQRFAQRSRRRRQAGTAVEARDTAEDE